MVTKHMVVEERLERKDETLFELRHRNDAAHSDDRMTLIALGNWVPTWKPGDALVVTVEKVKPAWKPDDMITTTVEKVNS